MRGTNRAEQVDRGGQNVVVVEQAVQIEAVVERGESLDCDAFGPQLLQALALQRVFDIGPRRPRRGRRARAAR